MAPIYTRIAVEPELVILAHCVWSPAAAEYARQQVQPGELRPSACTDLFLGLTRERWTEHSPLLEWIRANHPHLVNLVTHAVEVHTEVLERWPIDRAIQQLRSAGPVDEAVYLRPFAKAYPALDAWRQQVIDERRNGKRSKLEIAAAWELCALECEVAGEVSDAAIARATARDTVVPHPNRRAG